MNHVTITMYYWGGSKYGFSIDSACEECDISVELLRALEATDLSELPVEIQIKPWLGNVWTSLRYGGWHPPVILINNRVFSQGKILNQEALLEAIKEQL